jgi:hypothetical protein
MPKTTAPRTAFLRCKHALRMALARHERPYLALARWKAGRERSRGSARLGAEWDGKRPVSSDVDIVIEGYPRSANTYAYAAMRVSQGRQVRIAHHLHQAAQVSWAARHGIPVMLLIRAPEDAVLSYVVREGFLTTRRALIDYVRFYERCWPYADAVVIAPFEEVTRDFGALVDEVNRRWGTSFAPFKGSADEQRAVEELIERLNEDDQWRQRRAGRVDDTRTKPLPVQGRERLKQERRDELAEPRNQELLAHARALYNRYLAARARI